MTWTWRIRLLIVGLLGFLVGMAVATLISPAAHANPSPDTYYLQCLSDHGMTITDPDKALHWGSIVQQRELYNAPSAEIVTLLENNGADYHMARIIMGCAAETWTS